MCSQKGKDIWGTKVKDGKADYVPEKFNVTLYHENGPHMAAAGEWKDPIRNCQLSFNLAHTSPHISPSQQTRTTCQLKENVQTLKLFSQLYCPASPDRQGGAGVTVFSAYFIFLTQVEVTGNRDTPVTAAKEFILNISGLIGHYLSHAHTHTCAHTRTHTHTHTHTHTDSCWHIKRCTAPASWNVTDGVKFGRAA